MNEGETCEFCAYFAESRQVLPAPGMPPNPNIGTCHRNPPVPMFVMTPNGPKMVGSGFPLTMKDHWCGEWKKGNIVRVARKIPGDPGRN